MRGLLQFFIVGFVRALSTKDSLQYHAFFIFINRCFGIERRKKQFIMKKHSVIEWLKNYIDKPIFNEQGVESALNCSLLWSVFEHAYFRDYTLPSANKKLLKVSEIFYNRLKDEELKKIFVLFKERYITDNQTNGKYRQLISTQSPMPSLYSDICKETLEEDTPSKLDMIKTVLLIIYKLRCNLVHGGKTNTIDEYKDLFAPINSFLMYSIEIKEKAINNQQIKSK